MPNTYLAAMLPRSVRQARLSYLPVTCVIGSCTQTADQSGMLFDVVMLPAQQFQRMKAYISLQHLMPSPMAGPSGNFVYQIRDVKEFVTPDGDPSPEITAKKHFIKLFALSGTASDTAPEPTGIANSEDVNEIEIAFNQMIKDRGNQSS